MRSPTRHASRAERRVGLLSLVVVVVGAAGLVVEVAADRPASMPRVASARLLTLGGVVVGGTVVVRMLGLDAEDEPEHGAEG